MEWGKMSGDPSKLAFVADTDFGTLIVFCEEGQVLEQLATQYGVAESSVSTFKREPRFDGKGEGRVSPISMLEDFGIEFSCGECGEDVFLGPHKYCEEMETIFCSERCQERFNRRQEVLGWKIEVVIDSLKSAVPSAKVYRSIARKSGSVIVVFRLPGMPWLYQFNGSSIQSQESAMDHLTEMSKTKFRLQ